MKKTKGFGLLSVIIIMIITAVISGITTGVIMLNNTEVNLNSTVKDKELQEFIDVYETLLSRYYNDIDKEGMLNAAEEGMLNFLGDKYTTYLKDDEYQGILDELAATYRGIGAEIAGNEIIKIAPDSPAEDAGLMVGDIVLKINDVDVSNLDSKEIGEIIKNDQSENIKMEVSRNDMILSFNMAKENLINTVINYEVIENTKIGYLAISKFSENLADQVANALSSLENNGITSLIVDVRNNVGGYLSAAEETSSLFLEEGKKIYSLQTSNSEHTYKDKTEAKRTYPIVVLINNNSASAAEILAAALKESYGATLVGIKSYGKGKVQLVEKLENGDALKYTSAKWLTPKGVCIDGIGISPDWNITGDSEQLNKAIQLLS